MSKILVFGGTTEGRQLTEILARNNIDCDLCVATDYGEQVVEESNALSRSELGRIHIKQGRLSSEEMAGLAKINSYSAIIDATHPFAVEVSNNIYKSFSNTHTVIRLERNLSHNKNNNIEYFESTSECEKALLRFIQIEKDSKILLTTGSKDLHIFCSNEQLRKNIIARVLPSIESLRICEKNGLSGKQIIAMQGPFSKEINKISIKDYCINLLVTKESGRTGGLEEKIEAAEECRIKCFVIRPEKSRKEEEYNIEHVFSIKETCLRISEILKEKIETACCLNISLCGIGVGNVNLLTKEAELCIEKADFVFGAPRMLENVPSKAKKFPFYLSKDIIPVLKKIQTENFNDVNIAILFSGDSGFFSGAGKLRTELISLNNTNVKVLPGISSMSYLSAKSGISYDNAAIVSLHGVDEEIWKMKLENALKNSNSTAVFFITSGSEDILRIAEVIKVVQKNTQLNYKYKIVLGFQLSYDDEKIMTLSVDSADFIDECGQSLKKGLYCGFIVRE